MKGLFVLTSCWILSNHPASGDQLPARDTSQQIFIAAKFEPGFILNDSKSLSALARSKPWLAQIDFSFLKNTQQSWDNCKCYSKTGASLSLVDFNNPALGKAVSLVPFVEPYFFYSGKIKFSLRGGAGLSYLTRIYNANSNPDNLFYSSRVSFMLMMNLNLYYALSAAVRLSLSAQFNHISNGGLHWPNYGMNFPTAGLGLEYVPNPTPLLRKTSNPWSGRRPKIVAHVFGTTHPTDPSPFWPVENRILAGVNAGLIKRLTRINALGAGGELYYDGINRIYEQRSGQRYSTFVGAAALQHYIFFGRLLFSQQLAYTVTRLNPNVTQKIYERYFLEYRIKGNWYAGVSLKAYGDRSDHFALTGSAVF
jgi:hypothetical protein